jgi:hypothetical protein
MTKNQTSEIKEEIKKYWYHAGEWHDAECWFVISDESVCNCNLKKNKFKIKDLFSNKQILKWAMPQIQKIAEELNNNMNSADENDLSMCSSCYEDFLDYLKEQL